jgi:hypothetical protein
VVYIQLDYYRSKKDLVGDYRKGLKQFPLLLKTEEMLLL